MEIEVFCENSKKKLGGGGGSGGEWSGLRVVRMDVINELKFLAKFGSGEGVRVGGGSGWI